LERCLAAILETGATYAYPVLQHFGDSDSVLGRYDYEPSLFMGGNYIDAMALVAKSAWAQTDGYRTLAVPGWEDYSMWCSFAEQGMRGVKAGDIPLVEYRVHNQSMLRTTTDLCNNKQRILADAELRHPWITLIDKIKP
jgi:hypothetical protein